MEQQQLFNILVGVSGTLGGWWLKVMWGALKDLQRADKELAEKVSGIEVLVAGQYVKKEEYTTGIERMGAAIFHKLDRIEDKLDHKADKTGA